MPRPKKITVEKIEEVIRKMKRMKIHQAKKIKIAERPDGQPIYHYPSISKAKIARALKVQADYLTSLQKKRKEISFALQYVGQLRSKKTDETIHEPKPGTKAYLEVKTRRQAERIVKLEKQAGEWRSKLVQTRKIEKAHGELLGRINTLVDQLKKQKNENIKLKARIAGLEMTNASLEARLNSL